MCCLYGLMDIGQSLSAKQKGQIISALAVSAEARGTDATGIAYNTKGRLCVYKRPWPAHIMRFHIPQDASVIMGHTRMTTQGSAWRNYNNHPFLGHAENRPFALAHNGIIYNDRILRGEQKLPSTKIETDSYIAVQLLEQKGALDLNSLPYMAEQVQGSFAFTVLDDANSLYFVKGDNPLCLWHFKSPDLYLYASTEEILKNALQKSGMDGLKHKVVSLQDGDILKISRKGELTWAKFNISFSCHLSRRFPYCSGDNWLHLELLKSMSSAFGYRPEDIEALHHQGLTSDEIEDYLYYGEF